MLCYGYWIRENAWSGAGCQRAVRADLLLAYAVTLVVALALFGWIAITELVNAFCK